MRPEKHTLPSLLLYPRLILCDCLSDGDEGAGLCGRCCAMRGGWSRQPAVPPRSSAPWDEARCALGVGAQQRDNYVPSDKF